MGRSLIAHLYYGFPLVESIREGDKHDEEKDIWLGEGMYESSAAEEAGIHRPNHQDYKSPEWREYFQRYAAFRDALPCQIETVGHTEFCYRVLAIRGVVFEKYASDDTAIAIPPIDPAWDERLRQWCDKYGFEYGDPSWQLAPYYA